MAQLAEVGRSLLTAAMAAPYLGREEEHALALRWKNQSYMTFLDQVGERQAVVAKTHRKRNHETHMCSRELVQGLFIGLIFPAQGEREHICVS